MSTLLLKDAGNGGSAGYGGAQDAICEVKGTAANHDGRSASLTAPNGLAQQELFRAALSSAQLDRVTFAEFHGTGTVLGDPIEAASTMAVLGKDGKKNGKNGEDRSVLVCGAVKANMGHLEGSAGMAGFLKLISTLCQKAAPPNIHTREMNPHISEQNAQKNSGSLFPDVLMCLDRNAVEVPGSVSSFGFGGSNAQAILMSGAAKLQWESSVDNQKNPKSFLPWRRLLNPLLQRREMTRTFFSLRLEKFKYLFEDHAIQGQSEQ